MEPTRYFTAQAYNNAWANYRLHHACLSLTPEDLSAPRTSFFPSIIATLNHILTVDWFYVSALEGDCVGYVAFEPEIPCPKIDDLVREQRAVDRRLIDVCAGLAPEGLSGEVRLVRSIGTLSDRVDRTLLHLFQHQVHHRGQAHAMLSGTDVPPPQLDEFFMSDEREQALRAEDFRALGFDEAEIWGG